MSNVGTSDLCFSCRHPLRDNIMTVGQNHYHVDCFVCSACGTRLQSGIFSLKDNILFCKECYAKKYRNRCGVCNQLILDDYHVEAMGQFFHVNHFVCFSCHKSFENNRFIKKEVYFEKEKKFRPFCPTCITYIKKLSCSRCKEMISGCKGFDNENWYHEECLKQWENEHISDALSMDSNGPVLVEGTVDSFQMDENEVQDQIETTPVQVETTPVQVETTPIQPVQPVRRRESHTSKSSVGNTLPPPPVPTSASSSCSTSSSLSLPTESNPQPKEEKTPNVSYRGSMNSVSTTRTSSHLSLEEKKKRADEINRRLREKTRQSIGGNVFDRVDSTADKAALSIDARREEEERRKQDESRKATDRFEARQREQAERRAEEIKRMEGGKRATSQQQELERNQFSRVDDKKEEEEEERRRREEEERRRKMEEEERRRRREEERRRREEEERRRKMEEEERRRRGEEERRRREEEERRRKMEEEERRRRREEERRRREEEERRRKMEEEERRRREEEEKKRRREENRPKPMPSSRRISSDSTDHQPTSIANRRITALLGESYIPVRSTPAPTSRTPAQPSSVFNQSPYASYDYPSQVERTKPISTTAQTNTLLAETQRVWDLPNDQLPRYPYEVLIARPFPNDVDERRREYHLTDIDFEKVFSMTRAQYESLPQWKRTQLRKAHKLF